MSLLKRYEISSVQNDKYKWLLSLKESRTIRDENACLVFGAKIVQEVLAQKKHKVLFQCVRGSETAPSNSHDVLQLSQGLFDEIDDLGTRSAFLVIEMPKMSKWSPEDQPQGLVLISPLQDPANLGALARTALAFGCTSIVLTKESAGPFLPKTIKTSAGAILNLNLKYAPTLLEVSLALENHQNVFALDMNGKSVYDFQWPNDCYLLVGEEGRGSPRTKIPKLSIPIKQVESLNATVACAIALSNFVRRV